MAVPRKPADRPPRFQFGEIVRVAAATGQERDELDEPFDASALVGQEVSVQGAMPTAGQDGWIISGWVESLDALVSFPEAALEHTGRIEVFHEDGTVEQAAHVAATDRPWRDDVMLWLITTTRDTVAAEATARRAAEILRAVDGVDMVDWRLTEWRDDEPVWVTLWVYSTGDALDVFGRVLDVVPGSWEHEADESVFISSRWTHAEETEFLATGVREADVMYRRWTSPRRRSRAEIERGPAPTRYHDDSGP